MKRTLGPVDSTLFQTSLVPSTTQVPSPESRIPNPEFRIPSPESGSMNPAEVNI
jgi:hypothetical protein